MKKIHPVQQKLLQLLKQNQLNPLTVRELQEELNVSSTSVVFHHITQLEKLGYLRRNPGNSRDYQIVSDAPEKLITYLNLYGMAQCGPKGSILDGNPIEQVPISTKILGFSSSEAFMVKAKGESMKPKINPNDLVIVKKANTANNGDVVVVVNNGEVLIKKYQLIDKKILLASFNKKFDTFFAADDFKIEGIVKGVYSYNPGDL